jgi:hypothetical protein
MTGGGPMRRDARGGARGIGSAGGSASLELVAAIPLVFFFASLTLQAAADVYTVVSAQEAARSAARAASLGQDAAAAADSSLPDPLRATSVTVFGATGHGVRIVLDAPRVSPLPTFTVVRQVELP